MDSETKVGDKIIDKHGVPMICVLKDSKHTFWEQYDPELEEKLNVK